MKVLKIASMKTATSWSCQENRTSYKEWARLNYWSRLCTLFIFLLVTAETVNEHSVLLPAPLTMRRTGWRSRDINLRLTLRLLMSYIYIYIYIYMEHPFLMFLDHTQRRTTVGRTPLGEWSACRRDLYLTTHDTHNRQISMPPVGFEPKISAGERPVAARLLRSYVLIYSPLWSLFSLMAEINKFIGIIFPVHLLLIYLSLSK